MKATKYICMKAESTVDISSVNEWFKKFHLGYKNLDDQEKSGKTKTIDSKAVIEANKAYLMRSTGRVSGKLSISQLSFVCHLHNFSKSLEL